MIEQLFGSKTRVKLLRLFYSNPNRSFYVREITRKIDEQINSVRRELSNLLSIGIIKSDSAKNRLYYEVNQKYEYYNQLRSIFTSVPVRNKELKEIREEEQIARKLRTAGTIELAFLTGTFVRESRINIDLFIVGDVNKAKLAKVMTEIEKEVGRDLNYTLMTLEEYDYRLGLKDRFLTNVIEAKKIMLIDASSKTKAPEDSTKVAVKIKSEGE